MLKWNGGGNSTILNMKNYLILKDTMAAGKRVNAGDIVELDVDIGNQLVGYFNGNYMQTLFEYNEIPAETVSYTHLTLPTIVDV